MLAQVSRGCAGTRVWRRAGVCAVKTYKAQGRGDTGACDTLVSPVDLPFCGSPGYAAGWDPSSAFPLSPL